jgi:hypothetical protein
VPRQLLDQTLAEIGRADGKATVLLATAGTLLGLLLTRRPPQSGWTAALWHVAATGSVCALLTLLLAVLPRHSPAAGRGRQPLAYFEDVLRASRRTRLSEALSEDCGAPEVRLVRALEGTSRIAHLKNRYIRWSVALLGPAVVASVGALPPG